MVNSEVTWFNDMWSKDIELFLIIPSGLRREDYFKKIYGTFYRNHKYCLTLSSESRYPRIKEFSSIYEDRIRCALKFEQLINVEEKDNCVFREMDTNTAKYIYNIIQCGIVETVFYSYYKSNYIKVKESKKIGNSYNFTISIDEYSKTLSYIEVDTERFRFLFTRNHLLLHPMFGEFK